MSENCNHKCESCSRNCSDRTAESLLAKLNPKSKVKKVIAVVSGKGGVGKSMVTSQLAVMASKRGYRTAIMDADIIYVIDNGSIAAYGTHEELLKTNETYKNLYKNETLNS